MFKSLTLATALFAAPALAQPPAGQAPPPEIMAAGQAFGECIEAGIGRVAASVTPEAGATAVLSGCSAERTRLEEVVTNFINAAPMPPEQKTAALAQMRSQFAAAEGQIAAGIRQSRAAPAAQPPAQ